MTTQQVFAKLKATGDFPIADASDIAETDTVKMMAAVERLALALLGATVRIVPDPLYHLKIEAIGADGEWYVLFGVRSDLGVEGVPAITALFKRLQWVQDPDYVLRFDASGPDGQDYIVFAIRSDFSIEGVPAITALFARLRWVHDPAYVLRFDAPGPDGEDYIVFGLTPDLQIVGPVAQAIAAVDLKATQALAQARGRNVVAKIKAIASKAALRNPIDLPDGGDTLATLTSIAYADLPGTASMAYDLTDAVQGQLFTFGGGTKVRYTSQYLNCWTTVSQTLRNNAFGLGNTAPPPGGQNATGVTRLSFLCDAPDIYVMSYGAVRVAVDGQFVERGHFTVDNTGGFNWLHIAPVGERRLRRIDIEYFLGSAAIGDTIRVPAGSTISPVPASGLRMTLCGDSFSTAAGALERWGGITHILGYLLGGIGADIWVTGIGGTGYENDGAGTGADGQSVPQQYKAIDHIQDLAQGFDLIVMALGINDPQYGYSGDAATYQANVLACLRAARVQAPTALIAVAGSWSGDAAPSQKVLDNEGAIAAAWTEWADENSFFVPVSSHPSGPWVDANNASVIKGASPDDTHPGDYGHDYLARRLRTAILSHIGA